MHAHAADRLPRSAGRECGEERPKTAPTVIALTVFLVDCC
jgi:hypothetical protein